jgi:predicted DNA-binding transcriptional regulator YafY
LRDQPLVDDRAIKRWILGFDKQVNVVAPETFRQKIAAEVEANWDNYWEENG